MKCLTRDDIIFFLYFTSSDIGFAGITFFFGKPDSVALLTLLEGDVKARLRRAIIHIHEFSGITTPLKM